MGAVQTIRSTINVLDELAGIIANPPTDRPIAQAVGNSGRAVCNAYGNVQLGASLFIGPAATAIELVCKPYFDGAGYDSPDFVIPFTGGQCDGVAYRAVGTIQDTAVACFDGSPVTTSPTTVNVLVGPGPITNLRKERVTAGCQGLDAFQQILVTNGSGVNIVIASFGSSQQSLFGYGEPTFSLSMNRNDGQPDTCGDPPGTVEPGANPPPAAPPFPPGEEPGVDPTGQPFFFIPDIFEPGFDPLPLLDEPLGGAPPAAPTAAGGDGLPGDPAAIDAEAGEVSGGGDGEDIDFGDPPEGRIWVGCIVETTTDSRIGNIAGTGPQSTVWPTVRANAALNYGSKKGTSNRINSKFHDLIRSATSLVVTGVFLQVLPGSTSKVFPLSALKCPSNPCEEE